MSGERNRGYQSWLRFEVQLQSVVGKVNHLDSRSSESAACGMILSVLSLADILPISRYTPEEYRHWLLQLAEIPLSEVHALYKDCASFLRKYTLEERTHPLTYRSFKHYLSVSHDLPLHPIRGELVNYLNTCSPVALSRCLTFLEFYSRIPIDDGTLRDKAIQKYVANEDAVKTTFDRSLLSALRAELLDISSNFRLEAGLPVDFSGNASSELKGGSGVLQRLQYTKLSYRKLRRFAIKYDLEDQFYGHIEGNNFAKFATVPKNVSTLRSISMEPVATMAMQKYVLRQLDPYLRSCRYRITLHDQTRNSDLARAGSQNRLYGTIDLSDASDLLSNELVREVFRGTELFYITQYTRTPLVSGPFGDMLIKKYAPMGSALCFPIECMIFAGITSLANRLKGVNTKFCVYGDDIVCHDTIFLSVLRLLREFGFRINEDKTFFPYHPFKESCGGEYLNGTMLCVFRLSRQFNASIFDMHESPQVLASCIGTANDLLQAGYLSASRYMVRRILSVDPRIPFTRDSAQWGLNCHPDAEVNWHLPVDKGSSDDYQRCYVKAASLVTRPGKKRQYDYSVSAWLQQAELSRRKAVSYPEDAVAGNLYPSVMKMATRYLPKDR